MFVAEEGTSRISVNPHLPSGHFHPYQMDESISSFWGVWYTVSFFIIFFDRNSC